MQVSIKRDSGMLKVDIDGKLYAPLSFKSFRPNPTNVSEFYKAGVRLFSVLSSGIICALGVPYSHYGESWVGDGEYDFSAVDRQMDMFIENAPDGYFAPMFQLDTRPWYIEKYGVPNTFTHLSQTAWDEHWRKSAADYLKAVIRHCEEKYGDRIYGYFLLCGTTTEWFSRFDREEPHPIKEEGFKKWCGRPDAKLPSKERLDKGGRVFLDSDEDDVYEARLFQGETVSRTLLYFASEAQSVIKHKKLLGAYFGYLFEMGTQLHSSGVLDYERVFTSPDVDMISSPSAYGYRKLGDPSAFMLTQKTLDKYGKLYFLEFDHITHVAPKMVYEPCADTTGNGGMVQIPGASSKCKSEEESLNLMWRDFVLCYGNATALWWFDMFDGWFRSEGMMGAIEKMIALHRELVGADKSGAAEIAVFAEGLSVNRVRKTSELTAVTLGKMRRAFAEMGAPYDLYSVCDLDSLERGKYSLIILLDCYDIEKARQEKIKALLAAGVTVLSVYAPNYANNGKCDVKNISAVTSIKVSEGEVCHGSVVFGEEKSVVLDEAPFFDITDENAEPLAYFEDGSVAAARREKSVYVAAPYVPSGLLRKVAKDAGVFIYSDNPLVYTYVNKGAIGVYNATDSDAVIRVPTNGTYTDKITGIDFVSENGILTLPRRSLRAYLLTKK